MITKQELLDKIEQADSNDEYLRIVRKIHNTWNSLCF